MAGSAATIGPNDFSFTKPTLTSDVLLVRSRKSTAARRMIRPMPRRMRCSTSRCVCLRSIRNSRVNSASSSSVAKAFSILIPIWSLMPTISHLSNRIATFTHCAFEFDPEVTAKACSLCHTRAAQVPPPIPSAVDPPFGERAAGGAATFARVVQLAAGRWRPRWWSARLAWVVGRRDGHHPGAGSAPAGGAVTATGNGDLVADVAWAVPG